MAGELGKASLELEANVGPFERNVAAAKGGSDRLKDTLEALTTVAELAQRELNDIKMSQEQGARSRVTAEEIISGVRGIRGESPEAAREIDRVHLGETQAAETEAAGRRIDSALNRIGRNADQAKRKLLEVRLAGGRNGAGVGPFGSGFGRVGVLGTAVGAAALTGPAAAPAAIGLLASIPTLAATGAGALGTLILAFKGVGKAIGGDKKAFDELTSSQKAFVQTVRGLSGWLDRLKQIAAQSLFPGLTKGLRAALSPGTVNAIETALVQLGHALGAAGAAWGKYFGSSRFQHIFGPLMQQAARNIGVLSDAMLHLFDAFGVLARAAIPFTNWVTSAIDKGAKFADTWLRAQDATGKLGGAMREAQTSLRLVGGLALALLRVVVALGKALYPVAKVAVKALTDGLNGLAGIIKRNQAAIREIAGGALHIFINAIKVAVDGIRLFVTALHAIGGHKAAIIAAIAAIGLVIALTLGPEAAAIVGVIAAVSVIKDHWKTVKTFFVNLGHEIVAAFKYAWYLIRVGALKAALHVVEPFSHLPSFLGGWARKAKDRMQGQLDRVHPPNMNWGGYAAQAGAATGAAWSDAFNSTVRANVKARAEATDAFYGLGGSDRKKKRRRHPKPGTHAWYMENLGYDPTQQSTFGEPPPFKDTGSGSGKSSVIPGTASHLLALASAQASMAQNAKSVKKEKQHLEKEIVDLEKADKILIAKWKHAHGKAKTELFNTITATENKLRAARKKLRDATSNARVSHLDYALAQAQVAVEKAQEGSKAWDRAIASEEKALRAEIRYWDKRAHNDKLSADARTAALKKELAYQKQLKALLNETKQAASANIAQFLSTFAEIENTFGSNAFPVAPPSTGSNSGGGSGNGKTNTHLHDLKNEARESNRHLRALRDQGRFPGSQQGTAAAAAVGA